MVDCCWRRYGHRLLVGNSDTDAQTTVWHAAMGPAYVGCSRPGARHLLIGSQLFSGAPCGDGQSGRSASCRLAWQVRFRIFNLAYRSRLESLEEHLITVIAGVPSATLGTGSSTPRHKPSVLR